MDFDLEGERNCQYLDFCRLENGNFFFQFVVEKEVKVIYESIKKIIDEINFVLIKVGLVSYIDFLFLFR